MGAIGRTLTCPECGKDYIRGGKFCAHCGTLLSGLELDLLDFDSDAASQPGTLIGNYRLIRVLAEGGMGRVYVAEHIKLGRRVAVKKLRRELVSNPVAVARFFAEARAVNRISHENIVEITDLIEQPGGDNCIIMELLTGEDLGHRLQRKLTIPLARALGIAAQTASALAAVHAAGMIHRDLKPDNIYLIERGGNPDFVKVLDFGVAKLTDPNNHGGIAVHTTAAGQIIGTPEYMSPEQAGGQPVDFRTDIYALGVILYEMISGVLPFQAKSFGELMVKHMTAPVILPGPSAGLPPGVQSARDKLLLALLAKDPADRPKSMAEVELTLRELLDTMELPMPVGKPRAPQNGPIAPFTPLMLPALGKPEVAAAHGASNAGSPAAKPDLSRSAELARVALVKRQTSQPAVEVAAPRQVSRIEVLTPPSQRPEIAARTAFPASSEVQREIQRDAQRAKDAADEASELGVTPGGSRLARASTDRARTPSDDHVVARGDAPPRRPLATAPAEPAAARPPEPARPPSAEPARSARTSTPVVAASAAAAISAPIVAASAGVASLPVAKPPTPLLSRTLTPTKVTPPKRRGVIAIAAVLGLMLGGAAAAAAMLWLVPPREPAVAPVLPPPVVEIKLRFVSAPPGATVRNRETGETLGITPVTRRFPRSDRVVMFELIKPGFVTVTQDMTLDSDDAVAAVLTPEIPDPVPVATGSGSPSSSAKPERGRGSPKRPSERPTQRTTERSTEPKTDRPVDRNGTLDVFKGQ